MNLCIQNRRIQSLLTTSTVASLLLFLPINAVQAEIKSAVIFYDDSNNALYVAKNYESDNQMDRNLNNRATNLQFLNPVCLFLWPDEDYSYGKHPYKDYKGASDYTDDYSRGYDVYKSHGVSGKEYLPRNFQSSAEFNVPERIPSAFHTSASVSSNNCSKQEQKKLRVRMFETANYNANGRIPGFTMSVFPGMRVQKLNKNNDKISSLKIPDGIKLTVYKNAYTTYAHDNPSRVFSRCGTTADTPDRSTSNLEETHWDNKISSFTVEKCDGEIYASFYIDAYRSGAQLRVSAGETLRHLPASFDDKISSLMIPYGYEVTAYEHGHLNGRSITHGNCDRDRPLVKNSIELGDKISSIVVKNKRC